MSGSFQPWLDRWDLVPDGEPFETAFTGSRLAPVRRGGVPAMLKIATEPEEVRGAALMVWWAGRGAAQVLAHEGPALLLERAMGDRSLLQMAAEDDDRATHILCAGLGVLHAAVGPPPAGLVPLHQWFTALAPVASGEGGLFAKAHTVAEDLLAAPQGERVLHGDMHHENMLDFAERGWLAIDPKGLLGERGFDYANVFCNPDKSPQAEKIATQPGRLARRVGIASGISGIAPRRLLQWVLAFAGLTSAWRLQDGQPPGSDLVMAEIAAAELGL